MNTSYTSGKSPMKSMFSSAFRREDIKLTRETLGINTSYSNINPRSRDVTPVKGPSINDVSYQQIYSTPENTKNIKATQENRNRISRETPGEIRDFRYDDLLRQYERMQEFYKTQINALTEEVEHYKSLYSKVLRCNSRERY